MRSVHAHFVKREKQKWQVIALYLKRASARVRHMASWLHSDIYDFTAFKMRASSCSCCDCVLSTLWLASLLVLVVTLSLILGLYHDQRIPLALVVTAAVAGVALLAQSVAYLLVCGAGRVCRVCCPCCSHNPQYDSV